MSTTGNEGALVPQRAPDAGAPPADTTALPRAEGAPEQITDPRGTPHFLEYWNRLDAVNWMGVHIAESVDGRALARFEPEKHHRGAGVGGRAVTGAAQAYIFDFVTGAAVASLSHGTMPQVTVKLDVTYHHPAYDAPLTFEARVQSAGRSIVFVEATCTDANGRMCSHANAIYRRFDQRAAPAAPSTPESTADTTG